MLIATDRFTRAEPLDAIREQTDTLGLPRHAVDAILARTVGWEFHGASSTTVLFRGSLSAHELADSFEVIQRHFSPKDFSVLPRHHRVTPDLSGILYNAIAVRFWWS